MQDRGVVHEHVERAEARRDLEGPLPGRFLSDVEVDVGRRGPELLRHGLAPGVEDIAEHHLRALGHQQARAHRSRPASRARDDRDLTVESCHRCYASTMSDFVPWNLLAQVTT